MRARDVCLLTTLLLTAGLVAAQDQGQAKTPKKRPGFLGVSMQATTHKGRGAIEVVMVVPDSAADKAGLRAGALILGFDKPFTTTTDKVLQSFREALSQRQAGESLTLLVHARFTEWSLNGQAAPERRPLPDLDAWLEQHHGQELKLTAQRRKHTRKVKLVLGAREQRRLKRLPKNASLRPDLERLKGHDQDRQWARTIIDNSALAPVHSAVLSRFEEDEKLDDGFRLKSFRYFHRQPLKLAQAGPALFHRLKADAKSHDLDALLHSLSPNFADPEVSPAPQSSLAPPPAGSTWLQHKAFLRACMTRSRDAFFRATRALTQKQRRQLYEAFPGMSQRFLESIYLHTDKDAGRRRRNIKALALLAKVDRSALMTAARALTPLSSRDYLRRLERDLKRQFPQWSKRAVLVREQDPLFGPIRVHGGLSNLVRGQVGLLIDLGGDDVYFGGVGQGRDSEKPVSVCLDLAGDDRYQSTEEGNHGAGLVGVGMLVDVSGDDLYFSSKSLAQGAAFAGVGIQLDFKGQDHYHARALAQGSCLAVGVAVHWDGDGSDQRHVEQYGQGFAGPASVALCLDSDGDDHYQAGMGRRSSYGTVGVYQSFSQGAACGFRTLASGGLGLLLDLSGEDRYVAGNFSQGGGYYFGLGMLGDLGKDDDRYLGSRYAQAFSAHSAGGLLYEQGGDDRYAGMVGALQGAAWDLSFSIFIDAAGDDHYDGAPSFSLGASAHNGWALFIDRDGQDSYRHGNGPARSGPNSYHGGVSMSLFIDGGKRANRLLGKTDNWPQGRGLRMRRKHGMSVFGRWKDVLRDLRKKTMAGPK